MSEIVPSPTLHGTGPVTTDSSPRLDQLISAACVHKLDLRGGERILDVGSGLGTFARDVARIAGTPVVCVEREERLIYRCLESAAADGEAGLFDVRQGDARELPLRDEEWGSFDVVHCRFVLETIARPQPVVESFARALRPGGRLVLVETDHDLLRMWPAIPAVDDLWRALIRAFVDRGHDPYVGRKLPAMMQAADLEPAHADSLFFGGCQGAPQWDLVVANIVGALLGSRIDILQTSAISSDLFDEVLEGLRAWAGRAGSTLWHHVCWAEAFRSV